ncbi:glucose 1-dehydrogenase [Nocardia sp. CA2R105]|uniref:glucose 1-dehydrogenase n=1 Tax=Nocardia coffeae TaxID=2873381 RepID=UPI001CA7650E|nr:glucose 1-dehydrogenase [Nocardia coffeae]MBY8856883.1 glucose 1-dehydrogenase [Nocardia coffeae]
MSGNEGRLAGRVAIVTGAARGQGEAIARLFVAEGARVVLADVLDTQGTEVAAELGDAALYTRLDVTSEQDWQAASTLAVERFGKLDALVNNAGILHFGPLADTTEKQFRQVFEVNQLGVFLGMRCAAPHLAASGGGTIVNTASINGFVGVANTMAYSASKWALRGMTRTAALELGKQGIRVNTVAPGSIATAMIAPDGVEKMGDDAKSAFARLPLGRIGTPDEIAAAVLFLTGAESSYCTGAEFVVDGGSLAGPVYD